MDRRLRERRLIERGLRETGGTLDLLSFGLTGDPAEVLSRFEAHLRSSTFAQALGLHALLGKMTVNTSLQLRVPASYNSYLASVLADAIGESYWTQRTPSLSRP